MTRYWNFIETPFGTFAAWVDDEGRLLRFRFHVADAALVDPEAERNAAKLAEVQRQVDEYSRGARKEFGLELVVEGPDFSKRVWQAMREIPFGDTATYGTIAKRIGHPKATREVGAGCGSNPLALVVPCHRVIGSDGSLTGFGGGLPLKRALLEHEARVSGIRFDLFS